MFYRIKNFWRSVRLYFNQLFNPLCPVCSSLLKKSTVCMSFKADPPRDWLDVKDIPCLLCTKCGINLFEFDALEKHYTEAKNKQDEE